MAKHNGEYIFYADESGDHSLVTVDPLYPIFVLSISGFRIADYCKKVVPSFQRFKFNEFGHDMAILHEREVRKQIGDFAYLTDMIAREKFMEKISAIISSSAFKIFSVIIDKRDFKNDLFPDNPYAVALRYCLEEIYRSLRNKRTHEATYFFVFEKRGDKEDRDLELEFRRVTDGENSFRLPFSGFHIRFADKKSNSTGMQIADLTARPIGLNYLRPEQYNRSFEIIRSKIQKCKNVRRMPHGVLSG
ncbi:MAG: DUF3800 domain-containing protein [Allorhizobium sp.]